MEPVIFTDAEDTPIVPAGQDGANKDNITISKAELDSLRRERDEARQSERFWADRARGATPPAEQAGDPDESDDATEFVDVGADPEVEGDNAQKMVEEFASEGVSALKKRGFITIAEAKKLAAETAVKVTRELISRERTKITSDAELMTEFPELKDPKSELFQATAKHYQKAVAMDPAAKKTPAALYLAAAAARAELKSRPAPRRDERDDDYEDERDRRHRADSQDSRSRGRGDVDDRDDMIGDEARQVIKAMGITDAEWLASKKETGGSRGRRR